MEAGTSTTVLLALKVGEARRVSLTEATLEPPLLLILTEGEHAGGDAVPKMRSKTITQVANVARQGRSCARGLLTGRRRGVRPIPGRDG